jgi:hypothetical protein
MINEMPEFDAARSVYFAAARTLSNAIERQVSAYVLAEFPHARQIRAYGEYAEDGSLRLRLLEVRGEPDQLLASAEADDDEVAAAFEELSDRVDPLLDWLAYLNGEDYLGEQVIDLVDPTGSPDREEVEFHDAKLAWRSKDEEPEPDPVGMPTDVYAVEVFGLTVLIRQRHESTYVHIDTSESGQDPLMPLVVEVNNGGEAVYE